MAATPLELSEVLGALAIGDDRLVAGRRLYRGRRGTLPVAAVVSGIGKANAAMAAATALQTLSARWILSLGVGGAYPGSALDPGDLAVADVEFYGDEGVQTTVGWEGLEATGVPLWEGEGRCWFNRLPVDPSGALALGRAAAGVAPVAKGPFVTVSTVTGTAARAAELEGRFGAVCENMEGAAVGHAALAAGCRFAEVRGISNRVGPRDRDAWELSRAATVAQRAALAWLDTLCEGTP
ncbi:MAG TPA: futalosine hydrolase [Deferrisomatales bacterium]|nr:futalosine hydrolase [Deferrisomatales bacterium]